VHLDELDAEGNRPNPADPNFYDLKDTSDCRCACAVRSRIESVSAAPSPFARVWLSSREFLAVMRVPWARFQRRGARQGAAPAALVCHAYYSAI
jgi:hypothetical protein